MDVLTIKDLHKCFGDKKVLCGLDMSVPEHSIFGFVGRNGSGKTTTMKAVLGLLKTDKGEIYVADEKVSFGQNSTNKYIGYLPDVPEFYSFLTAKEYLLFCGEMHGLQRKHVISRADELLQLVGLDKERHRIKGYSRGMKQRLGIAGALLCSPKLLICDEPTSALDPIGRKEILDILSAAKNETTILFSTHILSDVERICTDVAFLNDGKIAMQRKMSELGALKAVHEFCVETCRPEDTEVFLRKFDKVRKETECKLIFMGDEARMHEILFFIASNHIPVQKIEHVEPSLEALFLEVSAK